MQKTSAKIVFFGNERLATGVTTTAPTLRALLKAGYEVAAVVTNYTENASRKSRELEIKKITEEHGIPVWLPKKLGEIKPQLEEAGTDISVLVAYGNIVPQGIIDLFPHGIVNVHPSLLPKHRGPTPVESVMLGSEKDTGVSLMKLASAMDAGPIYAVEHFGGTQLPKQLLANALSDLGAEMIVKHLPAILDGSLKPKPQDDSQATYDRKIQKSDGVIDWNKPAEQIEKEIRAYAGWPKSRASLAGKEVIITSAKVAEFIGSPGKATTKGKRLIVFCKWGGIEILQLMPAGKPEMTAQAFLTGYGRLLDKH